MRSRRPHPKVVDELVPNHLSLGGVVRVLQNLLGEQVSIRDFLTIIEAMADWAPSVKQLDILTEYVRQSLARSITRQYLTPEDDLVAVSLGQSAERRIAESIQRTDQGDFLAMDPQMAQRLIQQLAKQLEQFNPEKSSTVGSVFGADPIPFQEAGGSLYPQPGCPGLRGDFAQCQNSIHWSSGAEKMKIKAF